MKSLTTVYSWPVNRSGIPESGLPGERRPAGRHGFFNREELSPRIHAKGIGVHGVFEVIRAVPEYTRAAFLAGAGERTEVFVHFSVLGKNRGAADSGRASRGFAVKFYTREGIYDLVGNNNPVQFSRDILKWSEFVHIRRQNPLTGLPDPDALWDFWSRTPESLHQLAILFSDRGTPASYRTMHGFGGHTYMWYNEKKDHVWVKYHWVCNQPIRNLTGPEAEIMGKIDPDHGARDLHGAVSRGEYPVWTLKVQIMTPEQAENFRFDPFDGTKVWYHHEFPLIPIGRLTLNRNPEDYFFEREQSAFNPGNLVPGIALSPDRLLRGKLSAGPPGPRLAPRPDPAGADLGDLDTRRKPPRDFEQPGLFYRKVLDDRGRTRLCDNLAASLGRAGKDLRCRESALFTLADPGWGGEMAKRLHLDYGTLRNLAALIPARQDR